MTTIASETRIGTCARCGTTRKVASSARFLPCDVCATDSTLLAERTAWLREHPRGFYPTPGMKMVKVSGRVGRRDCDESCSSAKGAACVCKCAGRNHGAHYA